MNKPSNQSQEVNSRNILTGRLPRIPETPFKLRVLPEIFPRRIDRHKPGHAFEINDLNIGSSHIPSGAKYLFRTNADKARPLPLPEDLRNLRFFNRRDVERLYRKLEGDALRHPDRPLVPIIGTGGTICQVYDLTSGRMVPRLDTNQITKFTGAFLDTRYSISSVQLPTLLDSSQAKYPVWSDVAMVMTYIWKRAEREQNYSILKRLNGFIIFHGTDTIDSAAAELSMYMGPNCPFSFTLTASNSTLDRGVEDVAGSVKNSFEALDQLKRHSIKQGFVTDSHGCYPAPGIIKVSDVSYEIFKAPAYPVIFERSGTDAWEESIYTKATTPSHKIFSRHYHSKAGSPWRPIIPTYGQAPVLTISPTADTDCEAFRSDLEKSDKMIINIVAYGAFTTRRDLFEIAIEHALLNNKLLIVTNAIPGGSLDHAYAVSIGNLLKDLEPIFNRWKVTHEKELDQHAPNIKETSLGDRVIMSSIATKALLAKCRIAEYVYGKDLTRIADFIRDYNYIGEIPSPKDENLQSKALQRFLALKWGAPEEFEDFISSVYTLRQ